MKVQIRDLEQSECQGKFSCNTPEPALRVAGGRLTGCEGAGLPHARVVKYFIPSSLYMNAEFVKDTRG